VSESLENRKSSRDFKIFRSLMHFVAPYKSRVLIATIALIVSASITLLIGQGLRLFIDTGFKGSIADLNRVVFMFLGLASLLALGTAVRFYMVSWIGERVTADLRTAVFEHIIHLHPGYFELNVSGEIQSRITTDTTLLQTVIGSSVSIALRNLLIMIGGLIWMMITNPKLTGLALLSVPLVVMPLLLFGRKVRQLSRLSQDRLAEVGSYVGEAIKNIKVVQAFNHQNQDIEKFDGHVERAFTVSVTRINYRAWLTAGAILMVFFAITGILWVGGNDVLQGRISAGQLTEFVFYAVMVASSFAAISEVYGDLQRAAGASERLIELLNAENLIIAPKNAKALPTQVKGQLRIENASFYYPSRPDTAAIDNFSLEIKAGASVALVGSSGAGKSTLIDLILRFYDLQQGRILFDGEDIRNLDPQQLRKHIALVPQQPTLFSGTIGENIRYSLPGASKEAVIEAAHAAYAHEFIETLPDGYDCFIGEGGMRLSGGQRQRIAIARALLKDPALLLLDEATSALDAESEYQVQKALEKLMENRTSIIIAHRLATVVNVDTIVVLDHGKLIATGTHHELLKKSELYARWARLQFDNIDEAAIA
jgi:ATP-binding cassette, subfamily B, bacterial